MSQLILAVDTTHEHGSLALLDGATLIEELPLVSAEGFGHVLHIRVAELLGRHGSAAGGVACFAAASGPGSFTGVRVGLACVKGLAEATGKPVVGVGNLMAIASFGSLPLRAALLDARRGEVYGAVYDAGGRLVSPQSVGPLDAWLAALPAGELEFLSTDLAPFQAGLEGRGRLTAAPRALAAAIGRIAAARLHAGEALDASALDADYIRRSDAELFWREL